MSNSTGGKGSATRPSLVDHKTFAENFNRVFGKSPEPYDLGKQLPPLKKPDEQLLTN